MRDALVRHAAPQNSWPTVEMRITIFAAVSVRALVKMAGEKPAADAGEEAGEPRAVLEERPHRSERRAQRELRQRRGRTMLSEPPPVERERRCQRQHEAGGSAHRRSL